jgi:ribonuclease J
VQSDSGNYASGHASGQDIPEMIETIDPDIVIPVHTEKPSFFTDNLGDYQVILPEKGKEALIYERMKKSVR